MLRKYLFIKIVAFLALTLTLGLVAAMISPGTQLGALAPVRVAMAQTGACGNCHNPGVFDSEPAPGAGALAGCGDCHPAQQAALLADPAIPHIQVNCVSCHEGADAGVDSHLATATTTSMGTPPRMNSNLEVCEGCHMDQYNTYEVVSPGRTFYGGSDGGLQPPAGWNKTVDFPYLNVINSGHTSVLESYEDRAMNWSSLDHQQSILPKAEADLLQGSTRTAYSMGITYLNANNQVVSIPPKAGRITVDRSITMGMAVQGTGGAWDPGSVTLLVPAGTTVTTSVDAVNAPKYQVKSVVTLPDGRIYTSYDDPGLAETARGDDPSPTVAAEARNWIFAALEALDLEGLDYTIPDPVANPYSGEGYHWPSVEAGLQCSQCHDPHTNKLRVISKPLMEAIAARGINPYAATKVYDFNLASRQDQIIAVCAQCHSEQAGGYSANDRIDRNFVPWAKPADVTDGLGNIIYPGVLTQYTNLFGGLQDWTQGGPIVPWQSTDANARGFTPYGQSYSINAPLAKVQHPEAETFFNSTMYVVGATCTDCHTARLTRFNGTVYTTHWFASPVKLMDGFSATSKTGHPAIFPPQNPCVVCHTTDSIAQSKQKIKDAQDNFNFVQERAQVALVNALKFIAAQPAGAARDANVATYRKAALRWEFYAQAENSMGFHNNAETVNEVGNARLWVDAFIPWPLTPVKARIASAGPNNLTLTFYDQANDEISFVVERATSLQGPYTPVVTIPTPNGTALGDVSFINAGLAANTTYFFRVSATNASGTSVPSLWATGSTHSVSLSAPGNVQAAGVSSSQINVTWNDTANETGYRIQRAKNNAFTVEPALFEVGANVTSFANTGLTLGVTYYYRVFAFDGAGNTSAPSITVSAAPQGATPPAAPTNLVVKSIGTTSITIGWRDNANNEQGFYVWRCTASCTLPSAVWTRVDGNTVGQNTITFTNTGLQRLKTYWYRVQAYNATGTSGFSNIVSARTR
jgi:formate-dependent nitrite reductase cytochrome c552 subunit